MWADTQSMSIFVPTKIELMAYGFECLTCGILDNCQWHIDILIWCRIIEQDPTCPPQLITHQLRRFNSHMLVLADTQNEQ